MQVTFRKGSSADAIDVYCDGKRVGCIRRSQDSRRYEYYHGRHNITAYAYENVSLDPLKALLSSRMGRRPLLSLISES
ncbi:MULTISPECIES: hypothetical protein [unclassified Lysobacter]|uniref:hypothetical protein n=1 Tax=unclassified Lysobacter TaxID=2635362 RepID=UPI00070BF4ED|nr:MULTISPECIES: hypothetical protein [unclassified Lysobacter]KRD39568.1 hypothetical protein ASE35_04300 [Lysobacter sp. Root916]KRD79534.1 hypothetical protein ASE43_01060 [Lysobacter sp. Root983]